MLYQILTEKAQFSQEKSSLLPKSSREVVSAAQTPCQRALFKQKYYNISKAFMDVRAPRCS